jgi:hypothetical protein
MRVPQLAEALKNLLASLLHFLPARIRVEGGDAVSDGTAAAKCGSQIVNRFGTKGRRGPFYVVQGLLHPITKADFRGF